jgi:hypothetical protein
VIRCSSISEIMTSPRTKRAEWSETAISHMMEIVRERVFFGVRKSLDDVRAIQKGVMLENAGIELYNDVFWTNLKKLPPSERRSNGIITGEADLLALDAGKGIDIKCPWSLLTFPLDEKQAGKSAYEWQARGYMCVYDVDEWEIAYCMLDTPDELLRDWDDMFQHRVDPLIPKHHRITVVKYQRDKAMEDAMLEKCKAANEWIDEAVKRFSEEHDKYLK